MRHHIPAQEHLKYETQLRQQSNSIPCPDSYKASTTDGPESSVASGAEYELSTVGAVGCNNPSPAVILARNTNAK